MKQFPKELEEYLKVFRALARSAFDGVLLVQNGFILDLNEHFAAMTNSECEDLRGKSLGDIFSAESCSDIEGFGQSQSLQSFKASLIVASDSIVTVEVKLDTLAITDGQLLQLAVVRDMTAQEEKEKALEISEQKFRVAFHSSPDSINVNRLVDGLYLEINQGFTDIMGYLPEDVLGKSSLELDIWVYPEDRQALVVDLRKKGEVKNLEAKFRRKDGQTRIGLMSAKILNYGGEMAILSVTRDITQRNEAIKEIEDLHQKLLLAYDETLAGWSRALSLRDLETELHSKRVVQGTVRLAEIIAYPACEIKHLRRGAILHDIGKMGVPDHVLLKPGPLTDEGWRLMRQHPILGYKMLSSIPFLKKSLDIPYCHHERWDGSGYPRGLKDKNIPLAARIFSVIDVFDALTSNRPYRKAWCREKAFGYIAENAGRAFDPEIVESFLAHQSQF